MSALDLEPIKKRDELKRPARFPGRRAVIQAMRDRSALIAEVEALRKTLREVREAACAESDELNQKLTYEILDIINDSALLPDAKP